ncbi:MAG: LytTR family DNA-binding domain-containing protein, partial [Bacteroidota bacterium]
RNLELANVISRLRLQFETRQKEDSIRLLEARRLEAKALTDKQSLLIWALLAAAALLTVILYLFRKNLRLQKAENTVLSNAYEQLCSQNEKLLIELKDSAIKQLSMQELAGKTISVTSNQQNLMLRLSDILYLQSMENAVVFHTLGGGKHFVWQPLKHFMQVLPDALFLQTHRSYAVNRLHIQSNNARSILLTNEVEVPVGGAYSQRVREALKNVE